MATTVLFIAAITAVTLSVRQGEDAQAQWVNTPTMLTAIRLVLFVIKESSGRLVDRYSVAAPAIDVEPEVVDI